MLYNNRSYPHPVLGISNDVNGKIEVELRVSSTGKEIEITPTFKIIDDVLENLIGLNKALFVSHLYCRGTMYREVFCTSKTIVDPIKIDSYKLNGEVEVDFFICANQTINDYTNNNFNSDYKGYSFSVEKGDILAYAGKSTFYANKSPEELKSISALMNISTTTKSDHPMFNEYEGEKITIMMCQEDYEGYQTIKATNIWINILLSMIVLPMLTEALHFVSSEEAKDFADKRWYKVLTEIKTKAKKRMELMSKLHKEFWTYQTIVHLVHLNKFLRKDYENI